MIENIRPYIIRSYDDDVADIQKEVSLRPTLPVARYDGVVRELLEHLQNGAPELHPCSHTFVMPPFPFATVMNDFREASHAQFYEIVSREFTEHMDGSERDAIPRHILDQCVSWALHMDVTNPIFMGQTIMQVVQKHPKTVELWKKWEFTYARYGRVLPVHIIDLYTEAALARGIAHDCPHLRAARAVDKVKQHDNQTAKQYVNEFFEKIRELWHFYDHEAGKRAYPNNSILGTVNRIPDLVFEKANPRGLFYKRMAQDVCKDRKLPWNMWVNDASEWDTAFRSIQDAYTAFAWAVDTAEEEFIVCRGGGGNKQRGHRKKSNNESRAPSRKNRNKSRAPSRKSSKSTTTYRSTYQTDPTENCTSRYCKRRHFPAHKVGALDDCGRICKLKLRYGIDCPTTVHEVGQRHFYRKGCKQAFDKYRAAAKVTVIRTDQSRSNKESA